MKVKKVKLPLEVRNYFSRIGKLGGSKGKVEDKRRAALKRWAIERQADVGKELQ